MWNVQTHRSTTALYPDELHAVMIILRFYAANKTKARSMLFQSDALVFKSLKNLNRSVFLTLS